MIIASVSFSRFCAVLGLLSFCGDYFLLCFFPQGLLHFGFDVVVSVATSGFFLRFCAFWFYCCCDGGDYFLLVFLKVLCIHVYKKESEKKGFPFVVVAAAAGDGKDPKGNIVKATAYR